MRKRILSILGACLVLVSVLALFVVPVGAVSNASGRVVYSPIFFDYIGIGLNEEQNEWVFNSSQIGTYFASFNVGSASTGYGGFVDCGDNFFDGTFYLSSSSGGRFVFGCDRSQIVSIDSLNSLVLTGYNDTGTTYSNVEIECVIQQVEHLPYSTSYSIKTVTNMRYFDENVSVVELGKHIAEVISPYARGGVVLLASCRIVIDYYNDEGFNEAGHQISYTPMNVRPTLGAWFATQDVRAVADGGEPVNLFDWLLTSAEAFMAFEIGPGLSISEIITLVLVIGLLLWFVRLLS